MNELKPWVCDECGMTFPWGDAHGHVEEEEPMSEYPTRTMVRFLEEVEGIMEKYGIKNRSGFIWHDQQGTYIDIQFRLEKPKSPPDLGVKVSDGLGVEDEVR